MKNRFLALALVVSLVAVFSVSAFAVESETDSVAADTPGEVVAGPVADTVPDSDSDSPGSAAAAPAEDDAVTEETPPADTPVYTIFESSPEPTIWDKPFTEYTTTEGYLCIVAVLLMTAIVLSIFRKGI